MAGALEPAGAALAAPAAPAAAEAGSAGDAAAGDAALHRKLVWLTLFRMATVTVLLGGTALVSWQVGSASDPSTRPLYAVVLVSYVASLGFALALRARRADVPIAYAQVGLDVALAAVVVAITGGAESMFVFMYALAIVNGSILRYRRGAVVAAAAAIAVHVAVSVRTAGGHAPLPNLFAQAAALAAIAALTSFLAELLRATDARLLAREGDLAAFTALHESIVQSVTSGLLTLDREGRVTFLNRAGEQITALAFDALRGRPAVPAFADFRGEVARAEADFVRPSGERLRLGYSAFPLRGRSGETVGTAVIFQDLTRMRAMEEAMARSERLADLGRVAAGLAHELRNPLAAMSGSLELLRATAALDGEQRRLMEIVQREAARLDALVRDFLAFARPAPPRRTPTDLAALAADALAVFAHDPAAAGVRVGVALAPAWAHADPDQVRQVLWNLVTNAAHAAAHGGGGAVRVGSGSDVRGAWLLVEDDGPGVSEEDRHRLFLPFFTTKPGGTGLGLATVQRIVDAHGGTVEVDAAPSGGARFTVRLPASAPGAPSS